MEGKAIERREGSAGTPREGRGTLESWPADAPAPGVKSLVLFKTHFFHLFPHHARVFLYVLECT